MFKQIIFVAIVASSMAGTSLAYCHDDLELNEAAAGSAIQLPIQGHSTDRKPVG